MVILRFSQLHAEVEALASPLGRASTVDAFLSVTHQHMSRSSLLAVFLQTVGALQYSRSCIGLLLLGLTHCLTECGTCGSPVGGGAGGDISSSTKFDQSDAVGIRVANVAVTNTSTGMVSSTRSGVYGQAVRQECASTAVALGQRLGVQLLQRMGVLLQIQVVGRKVEMVSSGKLSLAGTGVTRSGLTDDLQNFAIDTLVDAASTAEGGAGSVVDHKAIGLEAAVTELALLQVQ